MVTNTFGGLVGLLLYDATSRYFESENLDRFFTAVGVVTVLLAALFLGLLLSSGVRYQ